MKIALALLIALLVAGGSYFLFVKKTQAPVTPALTTVGSVQPEAATTTTPVIAMPVAITYDGTSFSPATMTIKKGDKITFVNSSTGSMWVASDPHPSHQGYSGTTVSQHCPDTAGTAFDQCSTGNSYSFVFQKTGTWTYHNHTNHSARGTIVVTP